MIDEESRAWKQGFVDIVDWLQGMYKTPDEYGEICKDLDGQIPVTSIGKRDEWVEMMASKVEFYTEHDLKYVRGKSYFTVKVDNATCKFEFRIWEYYSEYSIEYGRHITVVYPTHHRLGYPSENSLEQRYYYKEEERS